MRNAILLGVAMLALVGCKKQKRPESGGPPGSGSGSGEVPPPVGKPAAANPEIATALAGRSTPVMALPVMKAEPLGRCGVKIAAATKDDLAKVMAEFTARNPGPWGVPEIPDLSRVDPWGGDVTLVQVGQADAPATPRPAGVTDQQLAADFVVKNHELFGLTPEDLAIAKLEAGSRPGEIVVEGERPQPGYEKFASLARSFKLSVVVGPTAVRGVMGQVRVLPPFTMCTDAKLEPDAAKQKLVGLELSFGDMTGKPTSAGKIEAGDLGTPELVIHGERDAAGASTLRLGWQIGVKRGGMPWTFVLDADSGEVLSEHQEFET